MAQDHRERMLNFRLVTFVFAAATVLVICFVLDTSYRKKVIQHLSYLPYYLIDKWTNTTETINTLSQDVTIVTGYFNLGTFRKGPSGSFNPDLYRKWMKTFSILQNPLVVFVETTEDFNFFTELRSSYPANVTVIRHISRNDLWAFRLEPRINEIYNSSSYPKFYPNTVKASYSCAMHAKYEFMKIVAEENVFRTQYIAWVDIGYFRDLNVEKEKSFSLFIPPGLNEDKVAYGQVYTRDTKKTFRDIFLGNHVWVAGGFFIGSVNVISAWTQTYMHYVEKYLKAGVMNTDQQVLYSMANLGILNNTIQIFRGRSGNPWFFLGFTCKAAGSKRNSLH